MSSAAPEVYLWSAPGLSKLECECTGPGLLCSKFLPIMLLSIDCFIRVYSGLGIHVTDYSDECDCSIRVI